MANYSAGGWVVRETKNAQGRVVDDSPVLMRRPDGQPCNIQAQYVPFYEARGYEVVDDPLDFDDVIRSVQPAKKSKAELRKERDERKKEQEEKKK